MAGGNGGGLSDDSRQMLIDMWILDYKGYLAAQARGKTVSAADKTAGHYDAAMRHMEEKLGMSRQRLIRETYGELPLPAVDDEPPPGYGPKDESRTSGHRYPSDAERDAAIARDREAQRRWDEEQRRRRQENFFRATVRRIVYWMLDWYDRRNDNGFRDDDPDNPDGPDDK